MTDTTPRLTVITPDGEFPTSDPRAAQALAAYVRTPGALKLDQEKIESLNAALAVIPQDGACVRCGKRLPMFLFRCEHWEVFGFSHAHNLWLCTRCASDGEELADNGDPICEELVRDANGWDTFAPAPRTALERAFAVGPIAGPIRGYSPPKEATP